MIQLINFAEEFDAANARWRELEALGAKNLDDVPNAIDALNPEQLRFMVLEAIVRDRLGIGEGPRGATAAVAADQ